MKTRKVFWNSKTISVISGLAFLFVICIIFASNSYMNSCVRHESESQNHRYELSKLGESLAEASDYLTDEARKYAVTGDITYFYNYWCEVYQTQTRDNVIRQLKSYDPPQTERELLEEAKKFSDQLITTETYSMKLILLADGKTEADFSGESDVQVYVEKVLACELPEGYQNLQKDQMKQVAIDILFDDNYMNSKHRIMTPIDDFQDIMNERLNQDVEISARGRNRALILQTICIVAAVLIMGTILLEFQYFYIHPLNRYTKQLEEQESEDQQSGIREIRILPGGAYELREFGRILNELSCLLFQEVEKSTRAENNMRIAKEEAVKANQAKSDFLAHMSHELRTPLNAIMGYVYLLDKTDLDSSQQRYCDSIQSSSDSLMSLISDVLDFSKIESGNLEIEAEPFLLMDMVQDVYKMMENSASQKGISLKLDVHSDLPAVVIGDCLKLRQVLINLVGNGIKFTKKGYVCICLEAEKKDDNLVEVTFSVSDTGIGIDTLKQQTIFEPFVQGEIGTTRKYGGSGLGLAISKKIVEACSQGEGTLNLESEAGKGSVFTFTIPFPIGSREQLAQDALEQEDALDPDKMVLLVDDNEINLNVESEIIAGFGVRVVTALSGKEAIEYVRENKVDLIFMDIRMPEMDGYETSCKIRTLDNGKEIPIIALSADAVEGVKEKVLSFDMNDYITKPIKPIRIKQIMQKYFNLTHNNTQAPSGDRSDCFKVEECLGNLNGNERLLVKLCNRFLKGQSQDADYIEMHLMEHNTGNVVSILHDLKGVCGNLCLDALYEVSVDMEKKLQNHREVNVKRFRRIFDATIREVTEFVQSKNPYYEETAGKESYEQVWERFLYLCRQNDVMAVELFENNRQLFGQNVSRKVFEKLEEAVLKYDFEAVLRIAGGEGVCTES